VSSYVLTTHFALLVLTKDFLIKWRKVSTIVSIIANE